MVAFQFRVHWLEYRLQYALYRLLLGFALDGLDPTDPKIWILVAVEFHKSTPKSMLNVFRPKSHFTFFVLSVKICTRVQYDVPSLPRDHGLKRNWGINRSFANIWYTGDVKPQKPSKSDLWSVLEFLGWTLVHKPFPGCVAGWQQRKCNQRDPSQEYQIWGKADAIIHSRTWMASQHYSTLRRWGFCVPSILS